VNRVYMIEDNLYPFLNIYQSLSPNAKRIFGKLYGIVPRYIKFGKNWLRFRRLLDLSDAWGADELLHYQWCSLKMTLKFAYENVPFYRKKWVEYGIRPTAIKDFSDFKKVPFTTKEDIRNNLNEFLPNNLSPSRVLRVSTGGSSGDPLKLYYQKGMVRPKEYAFISHMWTRLGYHDGDKIAVLRSALVRGRRNKHLWEYDPTRNRWIFSTFDLTQENMPRIVDKIREIDPYFLHVYPSALTSIAAYLKEKSIYRPFKCLKGILSASENTYPWQIELFKEIFGKSVSVLRWYGLSELSALAGSCEYSYDYHIFPQYSYVELLDGDGRPVTKEGQVGMVVGTSFDNLAMPLIRYKTEDFAERGVASCSCGRAYPLLRDIQGRAQEYIVTRDSSKIPFAPVIFGIHNEIWGDVLQIQFVQEELGELHLYVVPGNNFSNKTLQFVNNEFKSRLEPHFKIEVQVVERITKTPSGKHKYLIQKLKLQGD